MKFTENHRQSILQLFSDHGFSTEQYSFKKRKGRIIILFENTETFSFFQSSDFDMDLKTKMRIDTSHFEVRVNQDEVMLVDGWGAVKSQLKTWIHGLI